MSRDLVAIGASWGGLRAVGDVLAGLPADFRAAVVVAQHRSRDSAPEGLAAALGRRTPLPVRDPDDKDEIEGGRVYVAPPDYHLLVEAGHFELSVDSPVTHSRPSIDVLLESVADSFGERAIGVVLTGSSADGAAGLLRMREAGGMTVVQDPDEAERHEMPAAAIAAGAAEHVCKLAEMPELLARACSGARVA